MPLTPALCKDGGKEGLRLGRGSQAVIRPLLPLLPPPPLPPPPGAVVAPRHDPQTPLHTKDIGERHGQAERQWKAHGRCSRRHGDTRSQDFTAGRAWKHASRHCAAPAGTPHLAPGQPAPCHSCWVQQRQTPTRGDLQPNAQVRVCVFVCVCVEVHGGVHGGVQQQHSLGKGRAYHTTQQPTTARAQEGSR